MLSKTKKSTTRKIYSDSCESPISSNDDVSQDADSSLSTPTKKNVFSLTRVTNKDIPHVMKPESTQVCNEVPTLKNIFTKEHTFPIQRFNKTTTVAERRQLNDSSGDKEIFSGSENRTQLLNTKYSKNAKQIQLAYPNIVKEYGKGTFEKPFSPNPKENARDVVISTSVQTSNKINHNNDKENFKNQAQETKTSEVSKPVKRKLFTQNVDMLSSKTLGDSVELSPQTKVDNKEKNKVRRIVTTQSCLYRNVSEEEENVLDLIHKIVPAEQIKATSNKINKTKPRSEVNLIGDISETFMDETLNDATVDSEQSAIKNSNYRTLLDKYKEKNCRIELQSLDETVTNRVRLSSAFQSELIIP